MAESRERRLTLPRSHRLSGARQFERVRAARMSKTIGPLVVFAVPNDLPHSRVGLAVSRRVGSAVTRNRLKRLVREAFRLSLHDLPVGPPGYDLLISVRPHQPLTVDAYREALLAAAATLHERWIRKRLNERK